MTFLFNPSLLRNLSAGLALMLSTGGCTQEPPGPVVSDTGGPGNTTANAVPKPFADYTELVWGDEFDGSALDQNKWVYEVKDVWFNNELQANTNRQNKSAD